MKNFNKEPGMILKKLGVFFIIIICFILLFSCDSKKTSSTFKIPDSILEGKKNTPESAFSGIGVAKAESDGEAILLAENNARLEIAAQLSSSFKYFLTDNENLSVQHISTHIYDTHVIYREKDNNGNWWCLIYSEKEQNKQDTPADDEIFNILRSNAAEYSGLDSKKSEIVRNDEVITVLQPETPGIPDWVINPYKTRPENSFYGLGAAKLDNDEDSILLAKERARRSLTQSIDTKITQVYYSFGIDDMFFYDEQNTSITSIYDYTIIPIRLVQYAKSKDGTWWVLLEYIKTHT